MSFKIFHGSTFNMQPSFPMHAYIILHICRPRWIIYMGVKYTLTEYVIVGWQDDDLPEFGQIQCIVVIKGLVLFTTTKYCTLGIDRHFHSYVIRRSGEVQLYSLSELIDYHSFPAHCLNSHLYIALHSHIENTLSE